MAASLVLLLVAASATAAATIHVPGDQPTIQAGIDAAAAGDTVEVACGIYYEHDIVMRSGITLRSDGDAGCCTIDAQQLGRACFGEGLGEGTRIEGLTFTRGEAVPGGAFRLNQSSLTIHGCVFTDNHSSGGGAISATASDLRIQSCEFEDNSAFAHCCAAGGAIALGSTTCQIDECTFVANGAGGAESSGGAIHAAGGSTDVSSCVFVGNGAGGGGSGVMGGGAMNIFGGTASISECLLAANWTSSGDGQGVLCTGSASVSVIRSTFWGHFDHNSDWGTGLTVVEPASAAVQVSIFAFNEARGIWGYFGAQISISCTDIYGNSAGDWVLEIADQAGINGNFSADPLFCKADGGDLSLSTQSPCLPGNHPYGADCGLIGALSQGCGVVSVDQETWAGIKRRYRSDAR